MKKVLYLIMFVLLILGVSLAGLSCGPKQKPLVIQRYVAQEVIVKGRPVVIDGTTGKKKTVVKPSSVVALPDKQVYFPDPTRGYIQNRCYNVFIKVWLDRDFRPGVAEKPDFYLPPKAIAEAIMPLGNHSVYAEGFMETREYGWKSVGTANLEVSIDHRVYYDGHYGWKAIFRQNSFKW